MDVCKYQKFGFCKFKDSCKNQHLMEICENLSLCANLKSCLKRHPMVCKSYAIEKFCKFQAGCAKHHKEENINNEMKNNVDDLEKMVNGLSEKIVQLENKLKIKESKESEVKEIKESGKTDEHPNKVSNLKKNPITLVKKAKLKIFTIASFFSVLFHLCIQANSEEHAQLLSENVQKKCQLQ